MNSRESAYQRLSDAVSRLESAVERSAEKQSTSAEDQAKVTALTEERDNLQARNGKLVETLDRVEDRLSQAIFRLGRAMEDS